MNHWKRRPWLKWKGSWLMEKYASNDPLITISATDLFSSMFLRDFHPLTLIPWIKVDAKDCYSGWYYRVELFLLTKILNRERGREKERETFYVTDLTRFNDEVIPCGFSRAIKKFSEIAFTPCIQSNFNDLWISFSIRVLCIVLNLMAMSILAGKGF